jgi:Retrotransposon gag protein
VGSSTHRREKIPDPPKYSGDRAGLRPFLTHLLLKLSSDHDLFPDEQNKMAYAIGRLEGSAFNHLLPYVQPTRVSLESVESFFEVLETAFGDPDRVGSAERALENLRQNNRDFATYYAEFSRLIEDVDWKSDPAIIHALKRGLSLELRQELVHHDIPESLTGFVRLRQKLDNRLRAFEAEQRPRHSSRPTPRHTPVLARTQAPFPVSIPSHAPQSATSSIYRGPAPMDLSSNRRKLSPEERARRIAEGLCLYCGGAGHIASVCPNSRPALGHLFEPWKAIFPCLRKTIRPWHERRAQPRFLLVLVPVPFPFSIHQNLRTPRRPKSSSRTWRECTSLLPAPSHSTTIPSGLMP